MQVNSSSYKDPSGFVFEQNNQIYRAVNEVYKIHYDYFIKSELYALLSKKKLLISHEECDIKIDKENIYKIIKPTQLPFISYGYEWSVSMLKDAALCTLRCALYAIEKDMILKDANIFNIQIYEGKPMLIDTLSFEIYEENKSWIAYRQFCENFVAPLLLMKYCNTSLNKLLVAYPNGIPISLCADMLPLKARLNIHAYLHIFLQNKISTKNKPNIQSNAHFTKHKMQNLLNGLKSFVENFDVKNKKTTWDNYYEETILGNQYLEEKKEIVKNFLQKIEFKTLLDLGANDGEFSMMYKNTDKNIIAIDEDKNCIENLYKNIKKQHIKNIHPLIIDLTNPTPSLGWANTERPSFFQRINPDVTLALALVHHLAIAHNITLTKILAILANTSKYVLIEFVEKDDPKVKELLANRKDIFDDYTIGNFTKIVSEYFEIIYQKTLKQNTRTLFLLKRKNTNE